MSSQSLIGAGFQITRLASTAEFITDDPPHWAIESYIPLQNADLVDALLARSDCPPDLPPQLRKVFTAMSDLLHHRGRPLHTGFASRYAEIDPDRDTRPVELPHSPTSSLIDANRIAETSRQVLTDAGYSEVDRAELEMAVGVASEWGVPLHVDFDNFELLVVYARGDIVGTRRKRRWRNWLRMTDIEVPLYQRVVVLFKLRPGCKTEDELAPAMLHLRMFKNVPKVDIDMLLPGTQIRLSWLDRTRFIVPSLGGIGVQIYKIIRLALFVAVITYSIAAMLIGLTLAIIGYVIRSVFNYFQTRNRYMLNLTRSLYYQKLDTNAGVAYRLLYEAEAQRHREVMLAYYSLLSADGPISLRKLKRRVQRMIRETASTEVDYRAADAIKTLESWNLIERAGEGLSTYPPDEAMRRIDACWDQAIQA
ncbi:MAG: TMEM143 family protein [Planctomycetaceae bacterium]